MGFWLSFFFWIGSFVLADFFRKSLPDVKPAGLGDFDIPTATEGRHVPVMFGTIRVGGPNVTWYGDYAAEERTVETGIIFKKDETIGYTYFLGLQLTQFRGRVAGMTGVWIGDTKVWGADVDNGGAPATVIDVNEPSLFGGQDQGGGFVGRLRCHTGEDDQATSAYLALHQDPLPAYRGYTYVTVSNTSENGGAEIGEAPQLRDIRIEFQAFDTIANGGLGDSLGLGNDHHIIGKNINPIVAAYEVFTNTDWGRALPPSDINVVNFKAAAETIYTEGLGFSLLQDRVVDAAEIIEIIEQHIDGYIGPNPITGQIEVTLARQGYVLANEFQANADNVKSVSKFSRGEWPQTFNKVLVKYADREKHYKDTYATAQDMANRLIQTRVKAKTVSMPGVHDADVANKIAWRTIRTVAQPLASGRVELDRTAYLLRPGDILVLTDEDIGVTDLPMRITSISGGDGIEGTIVADCVEDVFGTETTGFVDPPASDFPAVTQPVVPLLAADQAAVEAPYVVMQYDSQPDTIPRLLTLARSSPGGRPNEYEVLRRTRTPFGSGVYGSFESSEVVRAGFMTVGALRSSLGAWEAGNGSFTLSVDPLDGGSLDELIDSYSPGENNAAGIAVIDPGTDDEEWIAFTTVVDDVDGIQLQGVWRACCDTGMVEHALGARVWFVWTGGLGLPLETFAPGDGVEAKFLPRSPTSAVLEAEATALAEVEMHDPPRHRRPLIPRSLLLNGEEFPTSDVSANANIPPDETGVTVTARLRSWKVADILNSVRGRNQVGVPLSDSEITIDNVVLEYWLYNLDSTPAPTRVDAVLNDTVAVTSVDQVFNLLRSDLIAAGISTNTFAARLEIEVKHSPSGEEIDQLSVKPFFFDFTIAGQFTNTDPFFDNVVLLVGFDGTDASTTFVDDSNSGHALTAVGNAQLDTASKKFNSASLLLDGSGDVATAPSHADFAFGTGDFTVEMWVFRNGAQANASLLCVGQTGGLSLDVSGPAGDRLACGPNFVSFGVVDDEDFPNDVWVHVAACREEGVTYLFIDGVLRNSGADANDYVQGAVGIGGGSNNNFSSVVSDFNGWIDEVRVTKGVARYTADFTPPADPFPRVFDPENEALEVWFDASDAATITETSGAVSQWDDKSGNARHVSQATSGKRPVYVPGELNGLGVVRFDGVNDGLTGGSNLAGLAQNVGAVTVACVRRYDVSAANPEIQFVVSTTTSVQTRLILEAGRTANRNCVGGRRLDADSFQSVASPNDMATTWQMQIAVVDFADSRAALYVDGQLEVEETDFQVDGNTSNTAPTAIAVGSTQTSNADFMDGDIAEIIVLHEAVSDARRAGIEAYLREKWDL